jgi:hypothetical protein
MGAGALFRSYRKQYLYSSIEGSAVAIVFERSNADLKKLPKVLSAQTSDTPASLKVMCLLNYASKLKRHFFYFNSNIPTSGFTII